MRALVCVRGRARIRADACEYFQAAAERRGLGAQAFLSASAFNANISAWNTASVTTLVSVFAASGPARTAADCARSVADACAAVARGGAADACARARLACACSYVYEAVCGWIAVDSPMDAHMRSSAIELPLHLGLSLSNAHTHRPFPRCMYPEIRIYALIGGARVDARVCVCVCVCGGALHACKLPKSVNILARVLYSCVTMSISLCVCSDRPCSHPTRARAGTSCCARVFVCVLFGVCTSLATHVSDMHRSIHL